MTAIDVDAKTFRVAITATTGIAAAPEAVWAVLTDTAAYPTWNPFVRRFEGRIEPGEKVTVDLLPRGEKPQTMTPRIVEVQPGRSFTWLGRVGVTGVLDGRHHFRVEPTASGCRLVQHETLSGLLVPAFRTMLTKDTPRAFIALNDALAARVTS